MINVFIKGSLKNTIASVLNKNEEIQNDVVIHTEIKNYLQYSLIIIDCCKFSEVEKKEIMRLKEMYRETKIIVVIGHEHISTISSMIFNGIIHDYIAKPIHLDDCLHRILSTIRELRGCSNGAMETSAFTRDVMLQTITDHLLDVICQVDQQGNFIYISNSSTKVFGYNLSNLNFKKVVHPDDEFKVIFALKSLQAEAVPLKLELRFRTATSAFLWVEAVGNPLCDHENGICYGFIFALRNITDRKKMEDTLKNTVYQLEEKQVELEEAYSNIKANIEKAHLVQKQFFPSMLPMSEKIAMFAYYSPSEYLGGDYYNAFELGENHILFYLTDVSGHALDGAMLNIFIKNTIDHYIMINRDPTKISPKDIVQFVAQRYHQEGFSEEYFVCMILAIYNKSTKQIVYCNSGFQTPLLLKKRDEPVVQLATGGLPITTAIDLFLLTFDEAQFEYSPGSTLVAMTDGLVEQMSSAGEIFGVDRFIATLNQRNTYDPLMISKDILEEFTSFSNKMENFDDDVTYFIMHQYENDTKEFTYQSGSNRESLDEIRIKVEKFLKPLFAHYEEFLMYFHELVANALEHGNRFNRNKVINIRLFVTEGYIAANIMDEGSGFDWRERLSRPFSIENFEERGRGIMISKLYFDEIAYNEIGNQLSILKFIEKYEMEHETS